MRVPALQTSNYFGDSPMTSPLSSRRELLKHSAAGLIALPWINRGEASWLRADETPAPDTAPIRKQLIVKTEMPFNAEGPLDKLAEHWITPLESFYVRTNGPVPSFEVKDFTLTVDGLV